MGVGDGARTPAGQKGTALASSLWMGAENGSGVGLAAPLTPGSGRPLSPFPHACPLPLRRFQRFQHALALPLQDTVFSGSRGRMGSPGAMYPSPEPPAIPQSLEVLRGPPSHLPGARGDPTVPKGRGRERCWGCWSDTRLGLTVKTTLHPAKGMLAETQRGGGDTVTFPPRSPSLGLAGPWCRRKQKSLEIFTVYKSLFNWFLTLVLPSGC